MGVTSIVCLVTTRDCLSQRQFGIFGHDSFNVHVQTYPGPIKAPCSASAQECTGMPIWLTQRVLHTVCWDDTFLYVHTYSLLSPCTHSISSPFPFPPFLPPSLPLSLLPSILSFFHPSLLLFFLPTPKILTVPLLVRSYLTGRTVRDQTVLCACP